MSRSDFAVNKTSGHHHHERLYEEEMKDFGREHRRVPHSPFAQLQIGDRTWQHWRFPPLAFDRTVDKTRQRKTIRGRNKPRLKAKVEPNLSLNVEFFL